MMLTFGAHFFTLDGGGNPMMYINLVWMWGHSEVYIVILPAFGIFSEIVASGDSRITRIAWHGVDDRIDVPARQYGITPVTERKVNVLSLYWHFLDVVWIFVFTVVYLMGVM
jgi:hypothetical protein